MRKFVQWWGTDALTLVENPPTDTVLWWIKLIAYRIKWKILHQLFDVHWVVHERLRKHLLDFGIKNEKIAVLITPPLYPDIYPKKLHVGFVIMYYHPAPACLGGELRPSHHDGMPRMNLECDNNNIPYYYSEDGQPCMLAIKNSINVNYNKWKNPGSAKKKK